MMFQQFISLTKTNHQPLCNLEGSTSRYTKYGERMAKKNSGKILAWLIGGIIFVLLAILGGILLIL